MQDAGWTTTHGLSGVPHARRLPARCALAVAVLLAVAPVRANQVDETVVRIYPTAIVNADQVTLADIADLSGQGVELAGTWAITASPGPGKETILEIGTVQQALIRRGINPASWVFRGSSRCRISRPALQRSGAQSREQDITPQARSAAELLNMPPVAAVSARPEGPDPQTLEGTIHEHVAGRLASLGGRPSIQLSPAVRELLQLSRPEYEFTVAAKSDRLLGLVPLEVTIYRAAKVEKSLAVLAEVALIKPVVVSAGTINRGQTIGSGDVVLKELSFDRPERLGLGDINAIIGQRALRFINKDEMLIGKDAEPVPLINRNDLVTVTARRGGVAIKGVAKALTGGGYGDVVELRNESSKQQFVAVITGPKSAELTCGPAARPQTLSMAGGRD